MVYWRRIVLYEISGAMGEHCIAENALVRVWKLSWDWVTDIAANLKSMPIG